MKFILHNYILPLSLICILTSFTNAQVQKGDNNIGFSSSLSTQSASPSSINVVMLLTYERYLSKKFSLGVGPLVNIITSKGALTGVFGVNVFGNYGFITKDGKLYPYTGILLSVSQSISTDDFRNQQSSTGSVVSSGNSTVSFYGAGAKVGTKYFLTERVNLDLNLNYSTNLSSIVNGEAQDLGTGGIIQLFVGVGVIIGKSGT